jgi:hypothetical protein
VISEAFTVVPEVVYSPILPVPLLTTKRFDPDTAMPTGKFNPVMSAAFTAVPEVVYSPIVPVLTAFPTNRFDPDTAMPLGPFNPEISEAFTVAPEVVYAPIVPRLKFVSKILSPRAVAGIAKIAAPTESIGTVRRPTANAVDRERQSRSMALLPIEKRDLRSNAGRSFPFPCPLSHKREDGIKSGGRFFVSPPFDAVCPIAE